MYKSSVIDEDSECKVVPTYKLIILGMTSCGKTKLLTRYHYGGYTNEGISTLAIDFHEKKTQNAKFAYYDTAGQQRFRAYIDSYFRGSDACLLVYDCNSLASFQELSHFYNKVIDMVPESSIYIIGTKCDLKKQVSDEIVNKTYKNYKHFITSAKSNQGVKQCFLEIEKQLMAKGKKVEGARKAAFSILNDNNRPNLEPAKKKCCQS